MKSFTLSLALVASTAYALDVESGGHGQHGAFGGHIYGGSPGHTGYGYGNEGLGGVNAHGGHGHGHGHPGGYGTYGNYGHDTVETSHNFAGYSNGHVSKYHPYNTGNNGYGNSAG